MELYKGWFLAVKNFAVPPHYPRKIKYLQNIFKISVKKTSFFVIKGKMYLKSLQEKVEDSNYRESLYYLQSAKIINKTNSTTRVINSIPSSTPKVLAKVYGKLISRKKLVLRDTVQLKARYLCKVNDLE